MGLHLACAAGKGLDILCLANPVEPGGKILESAGGKGLFQAMNAGAYLGLKFPAQGFRLSGRCRREAVGRLKDSD